jgi:hypothetical protein
MTEAFNLWCLVQGDDLQHRCFFISMKANDYVADMRRAILSKKPSFRGIDAYALELWKVSE